MDAYAAARRAAAGRPVVVTGASSGIGAALCRGLAAPGVRLVLVARRVAELEDVAGHARRAGAEATVVPLDLRDLAAAEAAARRLVDECGAPGALVSNAGKSLHRGVAETFDRPHDLARTAATNYVGAATFALPLLGAMTAARRGTLVHVSSTNARIAVPGWSAYSASKGAMDLWVRSITPELARLGVRATVIELPLVATPMSAPTYGEAPFGALSADAAARRVALALARPTGFASPWWARVGAAGAATFPASSARVIGTFTLRGRRR
ncbi:SDR family NAD(P)-dependent oxidoreductase [Mariniluteicoccus flavus]